MRLILFCTLAACAALAIVAGAASWPVERTVDWPAWPARLQLGVSMLLAIGGLCIVLAWRLFSEDRVARVELALCRERQARGRADLALAESDLLLDRLGAARRNDEPGAQLAMIRAELMELQRCNAHDNPLLAARMELLCARVDRVVQAVCDARSG